VCDCAVVTGVSRILFMWRPVENFTPDIGLSAGVVIVGASAFKLITIRESVREDLIRYKERLGKSDYEN